LAKGGRKNPTARPPTTAITSEKGPLPMGDRWPPKASSLTSGAREVPKRAMSRWSLNGSPLNRLWRATPNIMGHTLNRFLPKNPNPQTVKTAAMAGPVSPTPATAQTPKADRPSIPALTKAALGPPSST